MARTKRVVNASDPQGTETPSAEVTVVVKERRRRRRGRTSSERGRAFRKRQEEAVAQLERDVAALKIHVENAHFLRGVWEAKYLRTRHSFDGSLLQIVREYHEQFRHGLGRTPSQLGQETFVHSVMDCDVDIGSSMRGPTAVLDQWRLHSGAFDRYSGKIIVDPVIFGTDECPLVQVQVVVQALIGDTTLHGLFPPAVRTAAYRLLQPLMGTMVEFSCRTIFQFTREGKIGALYVEINYVDGFQAAGMRFCDIVELLRLSALTPRAVIALPSS